MMLMMLVATHLSCPIHPALSRKTSPWARGPFKGPFSPTRTEGAVCGTPHRLPVTTRLSADAV
jgi:hypothetical protein